MGGWVEGWKDGWMDGGMDGWKDEVSQEEKGMKGEKESERVVK